MKTRPFQLAFASLLTALGYAWGQDKPEENPTWQDMISQGITPYRQLTASDFPINDTVYPKEGFHIRTAIEPRYRFIAKLYGGFQYAYIDQWLIFSGLNKNETSRKSSFKTMEAELPFAQALLDINEIHARQLAALKPGELPNARGNTLEEAKAELNRKAKEFVEAQFKANQRDMDAFAKATENGANKKKVRELAAEIRKRLEATPAATVPFAEAAASASPSPVSAPVPTTSPLLTAPSTPP